MVSLWNRSWAVATGMPTLGAIGATEGQRILRVRISDRTASSRHASRAVANQARLRNGFRPLAGRALGALADAGFASVAVMRRRRRRRPMPNSVRIVGNSGLPRSR